MRLTQDQRELVFEFLLEKRTNEKLKRGSIIEASKVFSCSVSNVHRIWLQANSTMSRGLPADVLSKMKGRVGRKKIEIDRNKVSDIPLRNRTNIHSMASAIQIPKSTLHRRIKEGDIRAHTNAIKPHLNDGNKITRLSFCLQNLKQGSMGINYEFKEIFDVVHIDEKWFFQTKESERYYLLPEEIDPIRTCKSKRFIMKVMFLAAVALPRFDHVNNKQFDGKIGIFPFVCKEPAQRSSKNRVAGTLETKSCTSVTKEVYRTCLIEQVLPAIRSKCPASSSRTIYIQQDNVKPHIHVNDETFAQAAGLEGFNIKLVCQPPNNPNMNVLYLGLFRSIQALQHQKAPTNIDEMLTAVDKAFLMLSSDCLDKVWLSLQLCMNEVIMSLGGNSYKLPHMGKDHLAYNGELPVTNTCDFDAVQQGVAYLQTQ